jgi:ribosomal protein L37AE/L43A
MSGFIDRCKYCKSKVYEEEGMSEVWRCKTCNKALNNTEVICAYE